MFWDDITEGERQEFVRQLETIDFVLIALLMEQPDAKQKDNYKPCPASKLDDTFREQGEAVIRNGELGVITVAGGQGTRLGWSGPKGTFPATPVTGKSLFQVIAEQLVFASQKYGVTIPWYIMTSRENDEVTRSFLMDNNCFGLNRTDIFIFTQGEIPAVDAGGKILLANKNEVAMNPDGHGGVVTAMNKSGALEEMVSRGVKHLSYVQVDNPLAHVVDPNFIGLHVSKESSAEATSKCVAKTSPEERVGVFCKVNGKTTIVEYSDLPQDKASETDKDDNLVFNAGSIAMHLLSTKFLQRIADDLPWHKQRKKVPHLSLSSGQLVEPEEPNAYKFERFVFDVLPLAKNSLVVQTNREEEFAPIKNATGFDSPQSSQNLQRERAARWLAQRGIEVPDSAIVEISPLSAASAQDLQESALPEAVDDDEIVAL